MNLTEFKTEYAFRKWLYKNGNYNKFPFIELNIRRCDDDTFFYRLTSRNDTIGLVIFTQIDNDEIYINLFEIQEKYQRRGYGKMFFDMIVEKTGTKFVQLNYEGQEAKVFWKGLGFHRRLSDRFDKTRMYKKIKRNGNTK